MRDSAKRTFRTVDCRLSLASQEMHPRGGLRSRMRRPCTTGSRLRGKGSASRMKFLHAADLHIDSPLRGLERRDDSPADEIRRAPRDAFVNLVDLALAESVDFVVLAGDVFDGDWKDVRTGSFFARQVARLGDIPVYIAHGNHDADSRITRTLKLGSNVHTFPSKSAATFSIEPLGVAIHGRSFPTRAVSEDLAASYPAPVDGHINIGVLHTSLGGYAQHDPYAPTSVAVLRSKGYDYWALGHVHEREVVCHDPLIVFPGNLQGRHVNECGPKGCMLVSDDSADGRLQAEFRPLDVVRWSRITVDLADARAEDDVLRAVRDALAADACGHLTCVRLTITGPCAMHATLIGRREELTEQFRLDAPADVWLEQVRFRTRPLVELADLLSRDDLAGEIARAFEALLAEPSQDVDVNEALAKLRERLPIVVVNTMNVDFSNRDVMRDVVEEARALVLAEVVA